jgi:hypothetical protein
MLPSLQAGLRISAAWMPDTGMLKLPEPGELGEVLFSSFYSFAGEKSPGPGDKEAELAS